MSQNDRKAVKSETGSEMEERVERLMGELRGILERADGPCLRENLRWSVPSYSDAELCQALVMLCEEGAITLGPAGAAWAEAGSPAVGSEPVAISGETLLVGCGAPRDYSDTYLPEEEVESLVARLGYRGAADEPDGSGESRALPDEESDESPLADQEEATSEALRPAALDLPLEKYGFSTRVSNFLGRSGAQRLRDLLPLLPTLDDVNGLGSRSIREIRSAVAASSIDLPFPVTARQLGALCEFSGSDEYVFDLFGLLCVAEAQVADDRPGASEGLGDDGPVFVEDLGLSLPVLRALKANGLNTVDDVLQEGEEGLRQIRYFGDKKVQEVLDVLVAGPGAWALTKRGMIDRVSLEEFCSDFTSQALDLTDRLRSHLEARGYPVACEPFTIMMLPVVSARTEDDGSLGNPEVLIDRLQEEVEASDRLILACGVDLRRHAREMLRSVQEGGAYTALSVPLGEAWAVAAMLLADEEEALSFDLDTRELSVTLLTVAEWAATLRDSHRRALELRLEGKTLAECGDCLGVTRERVRQLVTKALDKRPTLEEDRLLPLFEGYAMGKEQFTAITGEPGATFEYLALVAKTKKDNRAPLEDALDDPSLDELTRSRIRSLVDEGFTYIDGHRVRLSRRPVIEALLRRHASDRCISLDELLGFYRAFVDEYGMEDDGVFQGSGPRALSACLDRWEFAMASSSPLDEDGVRRDIRYYDWEAQDFEPLRALLERWSQRDIECSTALIMRDEEGLRVAAGLDLRDGYQLHCAIRRGVGDLDRVQVRKRPMLCFGDGDRQRQVIGLIRDLGSADAYELADAYEERYGVQPATFRGSFLKDMQAYESNGVYRYVDAGLTSAQRAFLSGDLEGRGYLPLDAVRKRFLAAFPESPALLLNEENLAELGYRPSGGLVVRMDVDEAAMFGSLIDGRRTFGIDDEGFGPDVFRHEAFRSELNKRIRAFEVVEYLKDRFLSVSALEQLPDPVTADDLRDYVRAVIDFMEPGRPYSVRSLREAGFSHRVSALRDRLPSAGDYFLGSLIATGYVGGRLRLTSINGTYLFCKCQGSFSTPDFLAFMAEGKPVDEESLRLRLAAEHGVEVELSLLRSLCQRAGVSLLRGSGAQAPRELDGAETEEADDGNPYR